jgi:coatomer subunit beta'
MANSAYKIALSTQSNQKIKVIADISLKKKEIELAIECYKKIDDLNSLLLIYSSLQLPDQLAELAKRAEQVHQMHILVNKNECGIHMLFLDK